MGLAHVTYAAPCGESLFPDAYAVRIAVRAVGRVVGPAVVLFRVEPDRLHVVLAPLDPGARRGPKRLARDLGFALKPIAAAPLAPPHLRPVTSRRHLLWLVRHLLAEADGEVRPSWRLPGASGAARRGGPGAPVLGPWEATCFPDLAGARHVPRLACRELLQRHLPRMREGELLEAAGWSGVAPRPAPDEALRDAGPRTLAEACWRTVGAVPPYRGRETIRARAAALYLGHRVGFATQDLARVLHVAERSARPCCARSAEEDLVRAIRLQVALCERPAGRALPPGHRGARSPGPRRWG